MKKKIDDLESQLKSSQKLTKEKEKQLNELTKSLELLSKKELTLGQSLVEYEHLYNELNLKFKTLSETHKHSEDNFKNEYEKLRNEFEAYRAKKENEISKLNEEYQNELKIKNEKLENLKKQIAGVFKDNSWERQVQIEDLTRELKKTQEEYEIVRSKLKNLKSNEERDSLVVDLINLIKQNPSNLNEFTKLVNANLGYKTIITNLSVHSAKSSTTISNSSNNQKSIKK